MVHPAKARILLKERKACVYKRFPFSIRLRLVSKKEPSNLQLKIDPGSVTTGLALVNNATGEIVWGAELTHRSRFIKVKLEKRAARRRSRRNRKTRYRAARFLNRTKPKGWLPPSLLSRLDNIDTIVSLIRKLSSVSGISLENCKFDTQRMENPEISGIDYRKGELSGYEVREYLLEKFNHTCVYCGARNIPLQVEHVIPKALGGTNRVSNLVLSCGPCNLSKGKQRVEDFLSAKPTLLKKIKAQLKTPLKDAASMNSTRWELWRRLCKTNIAVECGSGATTKYNRIKQNLPKQHWIDAACVGKNTPILLNKVTNVLYIKSIGHGSRQKCKTDSYGFPVSYRTSSKRHFGVQTGDFVKAVIPTGKNKGTISGFVTVRKRPAFTVGSIDSINPKYIVIIKRADGYRYKINSRKDACQ